MAKRKKQSSKVQTKKGVRARPAKKAAGKATKRMVVKAKPKRAAARKPAPPPVAAAVESVAVEVVEQPAPA
jgi:hypothetical protein